MSDLISVATKSATLRVKPPAVGSVEIKTDPSDICSVNGNGVYMKSIDIKVTNILLVPNSTHIRGKANGSIKASATNSDDENKKFLREGDTVTLNVTGGMKATPNGPINDIPYTIDVEIIDAGQSIFKSK